MSPEVSTVVRGMLIGFSIAAPVGPIGVLCIRRTLNDGRLQGLATGLGAAAADGVYGAIAALGLTWLTSALIGNQVWIRVLGGAFLLWLGVTTFLARPAERAADAPGGGLRLAGAFVSTFVLTLTNPMTILSFVAVFAGLGAAAVGPRLALLLVAGVLVGSAAWWLLLSATVDLFRGRFDTRGLVWVNRASGAVITAFGLVAIASVLIPKSVTA